MKSSTFGLGLRVMKFETARIHFWSDVVAAASAVVVVAT